MLRLTALILLFIGGLQGYGQDRKGYYQAEIGGGVTADRLLSGCIPTHSEKSQTTLICGELSE